MILHCCYVFGSYASLVSCCLMRFNNIVIVVVDDVDVVVVVDDVDVDDVDVD